MRALLDVNVLIALHDGNHVHHHAASRWLQQNIAHGWASCPLTQNGCLRIMAQPGYAQPQPLAVLMLNEGAVAKSKTAEGKAELEAGLAAHLATINAGLDPHEQLDCLVLVTEPWSVDNGFITPTFKVKRNRVEEVYASSYERWVGLRKKVIWL